MKKTKIIGINAVLLLLYLKFGSLFFWVVAVTGFSTLILFTIIMKLLSLYSSDTYIKVCQLWERAVGVPFPGFENSDKPKIEMRTVILVFTLLVLSTVLIYKASELVKDVVLPHLGK